MKPSIEKQRLDVAAIFLMCRDKGVPIREAMLIAVDYFAQHDLPPPVSITNFIAGK